jgi:hypothetical protein
MQNKCQYIIYEQFRNIFAGYVGYKYVEEAIIFEQRICLLSIKNGENIRAVKNLENLGLCRLAGGKEKYIQFVE